MVPDQTTQLLNWLDEEHRKDRATISQIVSQLDSHLTQLNGLNKGLQDLEERVARVQSQSLRFSQVEQALAQVKTEMAMLFEQYEQRAQQRESELMQVRQMDRERLDRAVEELSARIEELGQTQRYVQGDHETLRRIEGGQATFIRGLEETNKRIEGINTRLQVAEEWVKRTGALIAEVQSLAERLRQDRADALEAMRRADLARARQVAEWNEQVKAARREMDDWIAQLRPLLDLPKEVRSNLAVLRELETQLKQLEPRLAQRQRLAEETARKEMDTLKQAVEQRESMAQREWEFMREEWSKKIALMIQRFDPLDQWRVQAMEEFRELRERMDADRLRMISLLADILRLQIEFTRNQNARFDQHSSDLLTRVENERASAKVKKPPAPPRPAEENP